MNASEKRPVNPPTAEDARLLAAAGAARSEIRQRIDAGVQAAGAAQRGDFARRRAAAEAYLAARPLGPQPQFPTASEALVERFVAKAESLASSVARIAQRASAPQAVAAWLQAQGLPLQAVISGELADSTGPAPASPSRHGRQKTPIRSESPALSAPWPKPAPCC